MTRSICLCLMLLGFALADETTDRAAIKNTIASLNDRLSDSNPESISELFSQDADPAERMGLCNLHRMLQDMAKRPWSEITRPALVCSAIRFITQDVAIVDGAETQSGVAPRRLPLLFVLKWHGESWKIESVRPLKL